MWYKIYGISMTIKILPKICTYIKRICMSTLRKIMRNSKTSKEEDLFQLFFIHRKMSPEEIAHKMNLSIDETKKKLIKYDIMREDGSVIPGTFLGVFTGRFHYAKADLIAVIKTIKRTEKVIKRTDELYHQTKSINAKIIKEILAEMYAVDKDIDEMSAGVALGMTRKETWNAGAHFGIVLYDIDMVYAERIDYLLKRIIERKDEFYFDAQSNPENWYPTRDNKILNEYAVGRTFGKEALENIKEDGGAIHTVT